MKILDRAALVIGAAGMWLYMASVEQDRWSRAPAGCQYGGIGADESRSAPHAGGQP